MGQTKQRHNLQKIKLQAETTASARYAARVCSLEDARDAAMLAGATGTAALTAANNTLIETREWVERIAEAVDVVLVQGRELAEEERASAAARKAEAAAREKAERARAANLAARADGLCQSLEGLTALVGSPPPAPEIDTAVPLALQGLINDLHTAQAERDHLIEALQRMAPIVTTARQIVDTARRYTAEQAEETPPAEQGDALTGGVALRKPLEAKDCAVRASLPSDHKEAL